MISLRRAISISIFSLVLTGCGNLPTLNGENTSNVSATPDRTEKIGTDGDLIFIQSDNVQAAGYDESSRVMIVQFQNGAIYEYYGVPADLWTSFLAAQPHPWSQVGYPRLVRAGIPFKRIG
jgi:hypothetical protein